MAPSLFASAFGRIVHRPTEVNKARANFQKRKGRSETDFDARGTSIALNSLAENGPLVECFTTDPIQARGMTQKPHHSRKAKRRWLRIGAGERHALNTSSAT